MTKKKKKKKKKTMSTPIQDVAWHLEGDEEAGAAVGIWPESSGFFLRHCFHQARARASSHGASTRDPTSGGRRSTV